MKVLANDSEGSHLMYLLINSMRYATVLVPSTDHFFFFIIGASPAALSNTSTEKTKFQKLLILLSIYFHGLFFLNK